ncbi:hypothetical protein C1O25_01100 [Vibrio diazotrophicus]|uniref:Uncharacterized protein n=1 Tax=Vibrio diazotrophicus TaxID=685 RepID=A0ABX4WGI1_VIBDI|nr:hypothetical protein C1O25_01100 [Vibrio diazotrophicus]
MLLDYISMFLCKYFLFQKRLTIVLTAIIPHFYRLKNNLNCDFCHLKGIFYSIESPSDKPSE